jgi:hypothetical protein
MTETLMEETAKVETPEPAEQRADSRGRRSASGEARLGIRQADGSDRLVVGQLVDVSDYGFGVQTQGPLQVGARVTVSSSFFAAEGPTKHEVAQVVHCRLIEQDTYRSGLAFDQAFESAEDLNRERPSRDQTFVDYYEALQISPHADSETIQRVYRLLAQRYHPDNSDSGSEESFRLVLAAFRVLSDPEQRAAYDAKHKREHEIRWQIFEKPTETIGVGEEKRIRQGILSALYMVRQRQPDKPEMNLRELEDLLGCPREHLEFSVWYLRGKGFIERSDNSKMNITPDGVDEAEKADEVGRGPVPRLIEGPRSE